ncbi:MAG: hypothetical protein KGM15_05695 [Pseudomonadota bacterium]|nr:hypothetical protein [Pseudomonadota bacterium]
MAGAAPASKAGEDEIRTPLARLLGETTFRVAERALGDAIAGENDARLLIEALEARPTVTRDLVVASV